MPPSKRRRVPTAAHAARRAQVGNDSGERMVPMVIHLPRVLLEALDERAELLGQSRSLLARRTLQACLGGPVDVGAVRVAVVVGEALEAAERVVELLRGGAR